jgi:hypothetical protein
MRLDRMERGDSRRCGMTLTHATTPASPLPLLSASGRTRDLSSSLPAPSGRPNVAAQFLFDSVWGQEKRGKEHMHALINNVPAR